jgi:hypothetical protein
VGTASLGFDKLFALYCILFAGDKQTLVIMVNKELRCHSRKNVEVEALHLSVPSARALSVGHARYALRSSDTHCTHSALQAEVTGSVSGTRNGMSLTCFEAIRFTACYRAVA